jgi:hypothetical protein
MEMERIRPVRDESANQQNRTGQGGDLEERVEAVEAGKFDPAGPLASPVPWVALVLAGLGALMLAEAVRIVISGMNPPPGRESEALPAAT